MSQYHENAGSVRPARGSERASRAGIICVLTVIAILAAYPATAREWQIPGGGKIEADIVGLDLSSVILRSANGRRLTIAITNLAAEDLKYVKAVATVKQAALAQHSITLQQQSVNIQAADYWSPWYDLWVIQFTGPRGPFWRMVAARNSDQATNIAWSQNPHASLLWVKRFNRK